jgi:beta-aspartyl-peptidase (threonine type)
LIIVGSGNALVGLDAGWEILAGGGSALDAVEAATRIVEDDPDEHTVGYSGYPNLLGEVELDASIMDGATRRAGAVGALRGFRRAITLARRVMEDLPHVLVVGEGAARFAAECGMEPEDLLTAPARQVWRDGLDAQLRGEPMPDQLAQLTRLTADPEHAAGTVNVLALDGAGHLATAVSTSGWAWKYPGRLGDSPVIGAGNYADDRYGAAACTGFGELSVRACTARGIVAAMAAGATVEEACAAAIRELADLGDVPPEAVVMSVVALDREGNAAAASTREGATYAVRTADLDAAVARPRQVVAIGSGAGEERAPR